MSNSSTGTPAAPGSTAHLASREASSARRNALRAFYKLSAGGAAPGSPGTPGSDAHASPALSSTASLDPVREDGTEPAAADDKSADSVVDRLLQAYQQYEQQQQKKPAEGSDTASAATPLAPGAVHVPPIDAFVRDLVARHDLRTLLRVENELVAEIRTLDSEQKALVYNNYSKLTAASTTLAGVSRKQQQQQQQRTESSDEVDRALAEAEASEDEEDCAKEIGRLLDAGKRTELAQTVARVGEVKTLAESIAQADDVAAASPEPRDSLVRTAKWLVALPERLPAAVASASTRLTADPLRAEQLRRARELQRQALAVLRHLAQKSEPGAAQVYHFRADELQDLSDRIAAIEIPEAA